MTKFSIYYDDGFIYKGDPFEAPGLGVICIVDYHGQAHIDERCDYYIWRFRENGWTGVDLFGLWDYLAQPGAKKVLFGRTIDNDAFQRIHLKAYEEMTND